MITRLIWSFKTTIYLTALISLSFIGGYALGKFLRKITDWLDRCIEG